MKILWSFLILLGLACLVGIFLIAVYSQELNDFIKRYGFIILGYIGISSFAYGWLKLFSKKNK